MCVYMYIYTHIHIHVFASAEAKYSWDAEMRVKTAKKDRRRDPGKVLHTGSHKRESPLESATDSPLEHSSKTPLDKRQPFGIYH